MRHYKIDGTFIHCVCLQKLNNVYLIISNYGVMNYYKSLFVIVLAAIIVAACSNETETDTIQEGQDSTVYQSDNTNVQDGIQGSQTIVSVASTNQDLSTFVKAVQSAERTQMLNSEGPFTVFAPTNEAFNALPEGTLDNLMMPENKQKLGDILAYHVVEGTVMASDLSDGQTVTTVQGETLTVTKQNGNLMINGAQVIQADVNTSNGVVHIIDKVLMSSNN